MSKRARITLNPEIDIRSDPEAVADVAAENRVRSARGPAAATPEKPATVTTVARTLNADTVIKVVMMGLAVVAAVLLFKGRKP